MDDGQSFKSSAISIITRVVLSILTLGLNELRIYVKSQRSKLKEIKSEKQEESSIS